MLQCSIAPRSNRAGGWRWPEGQKLGRTKTVALQVLRTEAGKKAGLFRCFNALRDDLHAEMFSNVDQHLCMHLLIGGIGDASGDLAVDFDEVKVTRDEAGEINRRRAEIIQREGDTARTQDRPEIGEQLRQGHCGGCADLKDQAMADGGAIQRGIERGAPVTVPHRAQRHVQRQNERRVAAERGKAEAQGGGIECAAKSRFLHRANEETRWDHPAARIEEADQPLMIQDVGR